MPIIKIYKKGYYFLSFKILKIRFYKFFILICAMGERLQEFEIRPTPIHLIQEVETEITTGGRPEILELTVLMEQG